MRFHDGVNARMNKVVRRLKAAGIHSAALPEPSSLDDLVDIEHRHGLSCSFRCQNRPRQGIDHVWRKSVVFRHVTRRPKRTVETPKAPARLESRCTRSGFVP